MKLNSTSATMTQMGTCQTVTRASIALLRPSPRSSSRSPQVAVFTPSKATRPFPITAVKVATGWRNRLGWPTYKPLSIGTVCSSASKILAASRKPPQPPSMGRRKQKWEEESGSSSRSTISRHQSPPCRANLCSRVASVRCRRSICLRPSGHFSKSLAMTRVKVKMSCVSIMILMAQIPALGGTLGAAASSVLPKSID